MFLVYTPATAHGTLDERIQGITTELKSRPDDAALHFLLADVYGQHEEWKRALDELTRVDQLAPGKFPTDLIRGNAWLVAGKAENAVEALNRILVTHPDSVRALTLRARSFALAANEEACLRDYGAALSVARRLEPDLIEESADAFAKAGRVDEAVAVLNRGIDAVGPLPSLELRAMDLDVAAHRFDTALARIDAIEKSAPRREPWMAKRAELLTQASRTAEARAAWTTLIAHLQTLPNLERGSHAFSLLAEQAQRELTRLTAQEDARLLAENRSVLPGRARNRGAFLEELSRLDEQVAAAPDDAHLKYERGLLRLMNGDTDAALADLDESERLAPGQWPTDVVRAQVFAVRGKLADAEKLLSAAIVHRPDNSTALAARGRIRLAQGNAAAAISDFRESIVLLSHPSSDDYLEAADVLYSNGNDAEALSILNSASQSLGNVPALLTRAIAWEVSGKHYDAALEHLRAMESSSPTPLIWQAKRARLLAQSGRPDESQKLWRSIQQSLDVLPNLKRGTPEYRALASEAAQALSFAEKFTRHSTPIASFNSP